MLVMKFGGASVKDAGRLANVVKIVQAHLGTQGLVVVVSAMDKTTNALERLAQLATGGKAVETHAQLAAIRDFHHGVIDGHFGDQATAVKAMIRPYFDELERVVQGVLLLGEFPARIYDRIMAYGELISSVILHQALAHAGVPTDWVDARKIVVTDSSYKQAEVIWGATLERIREQVKPLLRPKAAVVVQGYIASTAEGRTTTLGREGSDYTASIFGHALGADRVVIWKDVPGVMSADPRVDAEFATKIDRLTYESAVEMTFYGASVIHPKTIKPLQNQGIPLEVRSFLEPAGAGTRIGGANDAPGVPSRIHKRNQLLLTIRPRDFSFMDEPHLRRVFEATQAAGLNVNLVQTSAISLQLAADAQPDALADTRSALADQFVTDVAEGLRLTSLLYHVQHGRVDYPQLLAEMGPGEVLLLQQDAHHIHLLLRES